MWNELCFRDKALGSTYILILGRVWIAQMFFLFIIKYYIAFVLCFNVKARGNPVYLDLSQQLDKSINVMYLKVIIYNRILTKTNQGRKSNNY